MTNNTSIFDSAYLCRKERGYTIVLDFTVKRNRQSVTQGEATVYLNGEKLVTFGDKIELIKDGQSYYGENIGGWASVKPDSDFINGILFHPYDYIYHLSKQRGDNMTFEFTVKRGQSK